MKKIGLCMALGLVLTACESSHQTHSTDCYTKLETGRASGTESFVPISYCADKNGGAAVVSRSGYQDPVLQQQLMQQRAMVEKAISTRK